MPQHDGATLTRRAALGLHGIAAVMTIAGATAAEVLHAYAEQGLGPTLRPGDIVVWAHRSAHQTMASREVIAGRRAQRLYRPPYSPALAPMEHAWSQRTTGVRTAKARTREALERAIQRALTTLTAADAHGWFRHCGYTVPSRENCCRMKQCTDSGRLASMRTARRRR